MTTILITGGNGLLGYEVIQQLLASNQFQLYCITQNELQIQSNKISSIQCDLSQANFIELLPTQIDYIIHLAQSNEFRNFPEKAINIFNVNIQSTQLLLDYAMKASCIKFIYTSTGGVYTGGYSPFQESMQLSVNNNLSYYPTSKLIAEKLIQSYQTNFEHLIFRPFFIYGKRQKKDMLISRLVNNIKADTVINIDGENGLLINPIHVTDAAKAIVLSITNNIAGTYNLGGNEITSLREIAELIAQKLDKPCHLNQNLDKKSNDVCGDISKLKQDIFIPTITFTEGINEMLHEE
jgi:UDP-glucose 4-epimerase